MTKGSNLLVAALENEGVDRIFGIPGEENLDVVEAIRSSSIELVLTRHEQAAAFMAATYGRLTGKPGVCITTLGPGALNLTTGAAYALLGRHADDHDHRPEGDSVVAAGALPDRRRRRDDEAADEAVAPDRLAQHDSDAGARSLSRRAGGAARPGAPGASRGHRRRDVRGGGAGAASPGRAAGGGAEALDRAAQMIMAAKRPLLMLGAAASRPRSTSDLAQFVLRTRIPYFTTQMGKGTVPGGTEFYMGTAALSERDYVHEAIERADLIITIGHDTVEKPPFIMGRGRPQVIHVGYQPAMWSRSISRRPR